MKLKRYIIEKGNHSANGLNFGLFFGRKMTRDVMFDETCWYEKPDQDSEDINKLFGFGTTPNHHNNSVRFGWRPDYNEPGKIQIFAYQYNGGSRNHQYITTVDCGVWNGFTIELGDERCKYTINLGNGLSDRLYIPYFSRFTFGFKLFPYFGGQLTAPQKMWMIFNRRV